MTQNDDSTIISLMSEDGEDGISSLTQTHLGKHRQLDAKVQTRQGAFGGDVTSSVPQ